MSAISTPGRLSSAEAPTQPPRTPVSTDDLESLDQLEPDALPQPRVAIIDCDTGFITVLRKRLDYVNWEHCVLSTPPPIETIVSMRLSAVVVNTAILEHHVEHWMRHLRAALPQLGIVVCTAPVPATTRASGLRLGADDWIGKPCHPDEVLARLESITRRQRLVYKRRHRTPIIAGELEIRPDHYEAFVKGQCLGLTRREFEMIEFLACAEGTAIEREVIYSQLWGYEMMHGDRSIDVFIGRLRRKLEVTSPNWCYIHTHFGFGYRFQAEVVD